MQENDTNADTDDAQTDDDGAHLRKRGDLYDGANAGDARKLLDIMVGHRSDTLADAGGEIDLFELSAGPETGRAYVRVPVDTPVHSRRTLGLYGVESVEFQSIITPSDLEDVPLTISVRLETEGATYVFLFDMVAPSEEGDDPAE